MHRSVGAIIAPFLLLFGLASSAQAEGNQFYGTLSLGASMPSATFSGVEAESGTNGDFGAAFGVLTSDFFSWDIAEVHYTNFAGTDLGFGTSNSTLSLGSTFNWGYFKPSSRFHPFVSLGLGSSRLGYQVAGTNMIEADWAFEWNVGGGIEFQTQENFKTGIRYRYRATNRSTVGTEYSVNMHSISLEISFMGSR